MLAVILFFIFLSSAFVLICCECIRTNRRNERYELRDIERTKYLASISDRLEDIKNSIDNLE